MWSRVFEPPETAVVQVGEDGGDGAPVAASFVGIPPRRRGAPRARIKMHEQKLIHRVVYGIGFEEDLRNIAAFGCLHGSLRMTQES